MNCKIFVFVAFLTLCSDEVTSTIFLERSGALICTLNNLGSIPSGAVRYPVYQKVCRVVTPVLGAPMADEANSRRYNYEQYDDEVEKTRSAIMSQ